MDIDDVKTSRGGESAPKIDEMVQVYKFPPRKWVTVRLIKRGGFHPVANYWITSKKKDGSKTKFPQPCASFDPATQDRDSTKYDPWRDYSDYEYAKFGKEGREKRMIDFNTATWTQMLIRDEQENPPRKQPKATKKELKSGVKDKDSDTWTPIRAVRCPKSLIGQFQELKGLNIVKIKDKGTKAFSINDDKYGRDIRVRYDPDKPPAEQYKVQLGDSRTPLTEEEMAFLVQDLEAATKVEIPDKKALKAEFESWLKRNGLKFDPSGDDADDEDDEPKKGKKSKGKKVKSEDDSDDLDDSDDDDGDAPKGKKTAKSKKPKDDDDDDSDDDDSDDDDSDDDDSDDDGDDSDDEDGDDDEDVKPKKGKVSKSKKSKDEDDDFDDDDDDEDGDDDSDDEDVKPKKGKKSKAKDEDDDFDDDDDDSDDLDADEDDEPKKGKKSKGKKVKGKKSKAKDDDFDDDDD